MAHCALLSTSPHLRPTQRQWPSDLTPPHAQGEVGSALSLLPSPRSRNRAPAWAHLHSLSHSESLTCCSSHASTSGSTERVGGSEGVPESTRRTRRRLFSFRDWERSRESSRFVRHVQTIASSGIIRGVRLPVLSVTALSAVIAAYNSLFFMGHLPIWLPPPPSIAIECCSITSFALSLLLVFRTNAAYARFDEARRSFGSITTTARDLARQVFTWFPSNQWEEKKTVSRWLLALAKCSMMHLRSEREHDLKTEIGGVLHAKEFDLLSKAENRPTFCLQVLSKLIQRAQVPDVIIHRMDANLSTMVGAVSSCERILNTPIPLSYTRHTGRFLMIWMVALPFSLYQYAGSAMVIVMALVSFVLLGIEEIGVYIEEPFSILPLEGLSTKLELGLARIAAASPEIDSFLTTEQVQQAAPA